MKKLITKCKYDLKHNYYVDDKVPHIWSEYSQKYLSEQYDKNGYCKVQLRSTDGKSHRYSVHRLILENFNPVENMHQLQVDHIDGNKKNNLLENLRWVTPQENVLNQNTFKNHRSQKQNGLNNTSSKFSEEDLQEIIKLLLEGEQIKLIAEKYNVSEDVIGNIKAKRTYQEYTKNIDFPDIKGNILGNEKAREIIIALQSKKYTLDEIANMCGVSSSTVQRIKYKKSYTHLTKNINFM